MKWTIKHLLFIGLVFIIVNPLKSQVIIAHRGSSEVFPENTMLAFEEAIRQKVHYIELDVRQSKEDSIMVIHDNTLERTTNGKGEVNSYNYLSLKELNAGYSDKFGTDFEEEKIPSLFEVLMRFKGKVKFVIEAKNVSEIQIVTIVQSLKLENEVIISSYNEDKIKRINQNYPAIQTAFIVNRANSSSVDISKNIGASILITSPYIIGSTFRYALNSSVKVWFGIIDSPEQIPHFAKDSDYGIITNTPALIFQSMENPFQVFSHINMLYINPVDPEITFNLQVFNLSGQILFRQENLSGYSSFPINSSLRPLIELLFVVIETPDGVYSFSLIPSL